MRPLLPMSPLRLTILPLSRHWPGRSRHSPAAEAVGRICAAPAVSCPPAIPIMVSGETVPPEALPLFARYGIEKAAVVKE